MTTPSKFRIIVILAAVVTLHMPSFAQAEDYEWLKSPEYKSIFVFTDFKECDFMAGKFTEAVKRTFPRSNIKATISNSLAFQTADDGDDLVFELLDEELTGNNKIILYVYGKCVKYNSGFIFQFDIHFGVIDQKYSQALLYTTPRHSVIGVDTIMGIERTFRELIKNAVDDYCAANQQ